MQLIPVILLIIYALSCFASSVFWVLYHSPFFDLSLLRGLFSGIFYNVFHCLLLFTALAVSIVVLIEKKYSDKSTAIGMTAFLAVYCAGAGMNLINGFIHSLGFWRLVGG